MTSKQQRPWLAITLLLVSAVLIAMSVSSMMRTRAQEDETARLREDVAEMQTTLREVRERLEARRPSVAE